MNILAAFGAQNATTLSGILLHGPDMAMPTAKDQLSLTSFTDPPALFKVCGEPFTPLVGRLLPESGFSVMG